MTSFSWRCTAWFQLPISSRSPRPKDENARWLARTVAVLGAGVVASAVALGARAEEGATQIEVVRGTEKQRVSVGSDGDPRIEMQNGVEKVYGVERGTGRVAIDTQRYTIGASERTEIRRDIREMLSIYAAELGVRVSSDFEVELEVLGDRRQFEKRLGSRRSFSGFYRHETNEAVVSAADGDRADTRATLIHETSHAVLADGSPGTPVWLNEGLAEYFELLDRSGGRAYIPAQEARRSSLRAQLREGLLPSVSQLIGASRDSFYAAQDDALQRSYDQAWAVVFFLMDRPSSRAALRATLADIGRGEAAAAALDRHYPGGVATLDRDWLKWMARRARSHTY